MKRINTLLLLLIFASLNIARAQSDDRFYFPTKEWAAIDTSVSYEEVNLQTDTVTLNGIFLKPEASPKGTVLFFHGSGGNVSHYLFMTQPLVDAGFQVFMIDFRGYGKSTGKPTHLNIAKDGQFVFDYLLSREDVQDEQLILFGASIGTQLAAKLASDNPEKVRVLVLDGPFTSFTAMALHHAPESQHAIIRQYLTFPYAAEEAIQQLEGIPVLIVHSREDKDAPIEGAESLFDKVQGTKQLWVYKGDHLKAMKVNPAIYVQKIEALLESERTN